AEGMLVVVRPTGPKSATVTVLEGSLSQPKRRSIFPTAIASKLLSGQFVWWLENDVGFSPGQADNVSLKWISLASPADEHVAVTEAAPGPKWSPMDTTYARLVGGTSILTYGVPVGADIEVATFDLANPGAGSTTVTHDKNFKLDPYSYVL